jgi:aldose 1-epimerase
MVALLFVILLQPALLHAASIKKSDFGKTFDGQAVDLYTLTNNNGLSVQIMSYGATVVSLKVPDKNGNLGDVVLGLDTLKEYENESPYFGAIIGRFANRIANGMFKIGDTQYCVPVNDGPNHLHGGFKGYDKRVWNADYAMTADGPSVRFMLVDPDECEGYPGNVNVTVIYSLTGKNALKIQYYATTDEPTPINLTNHSYFNLKDGGKSDILGHVLKVYASHYTPVDDNQIPTGKIAPVAGTPIDFTTAKPIGRDIQAMGGDPIGYDHNFALDNQDGSFAKAAEVYEPTTGRWMQVWTTMPGMQLYSGNFLDGTVKGKGGTVYQQHSAFALECQDYPDAINHKNFPSCVLTPGLVYRQITEYRFSTSGTQPF